MLDVAPEIWEKMAGTGKDLMTGMKGNEARVRSKPYWVWSSDNEEDWSRKWSAFRKTFDVSIKVLSAEVTITGSSCCEVFINGASVGSVDKWGLIRHFKAGKHVRQGRNVVAVRALGGQRLWFNHIQAERSAFVLELTVRGPRGRRLRIGTDRTWLTRVGLRNLQWTRLDAATRGWRGAEEIAPLGEDPTDEPESCIARAWHVHEPPWCDPGPLPLRGDRAKVAEMLGPAYVDSVKTRLPERVFAAAVTKRPAGSRGVRRANHLLRDDDAACTILPQPNRRAPAVVLDFGRLVVGYLTVEFGAGPRLGLRVMGDRHEDPEAELIEQSCRTDINRKRLDAVEPLPGQRAWTSLQRRAFRYLAIYHEGNRPVEVQRLFLNFSAYPVRYDGFFECSDGLLNRIWMTARYTLQVCMHWYYESEPRQERGFFSGDGHADALVNYACFGDRALFKSSFDAWAVMRDYALSGDTALIGRLRNRQGLWDYLAWYVISLHDYLLHTGDVAYVKKHFRRMKSAVEWLAARRDRHGLIYQVKVDEVIQDWACSSRIGEKTFFNALFYKSLLCIADFCDAFGDPKDSARRYRKIARSVKRAVNRRLWWDERGTFMDSRAVGGARFFSAQDANALSVLFGVADAERAQQALDFLREHHWTDDGAYTYETRYDRSLYKAGKLPAAQRISPWMSFYEVLARFQCGRDEEALELIRRCWGSMLNKGATTFWEYAPSGSKCHAWSAGPAYVLPSYVLGIRPITPGFDRCLIEPRLCDLDRARGAVPTPHGPVAVACSGHRQDDTYRQEVFVPSGVCATVGFPGARLLGSRLHCDGKEVKARPGRSAGKRTPVWPEYRPDPRYVYADVGPGRHTFTGQSTPSG